MPVKDKGKQAAYAAAHYLKNKEKMKARAVESKRVSRRRNVEFLLEYLKLNPCVDCGNNDPLVLAFDHQQDKIRNVADMAKSSVAISTLQSEIQKCKVRCHNCHAKRTAIQQNWAKHLILFN